MPERPRLLLGGRLKGFSSAILLAAGASSRFGSPKMLAPIEGEPLLRRVVRSYLGSGVGEVLVVLGAHADSLAPALAGLAIRLVRNPRWEAGMLSSVRAGLSAVSSETTLVAISPADLPRVASCDVARVLSALEGAEGGPSPRVVVPTAGGRRGHPIAAPRAVLDRIHSWGDERRLSDILREPDVTVVELPGFGPEVLRDVDVPADLEPPG